MCREIWRSQFVVFQVKGNKNYSEEEKSCQYYDGTLYGKTHAPDML